MLAFVHSVTVDVYGHLIPGSNKRAVDDLDDWSGAPCAHPDKTKGLGLEVVTIR